MLARAALIALFAGCGGARPALPPLPSVPGPPRPLAEARALLAELRLREDAAGSWKAVHSLSIEDRRSLRSARLRGVLLVRRPDRFRLRLLGPAGMTAMDLLFVAPRYQLAIPGGPAISGADARRERRLPVDAMARAFLRVYDGEPVALHTSATRRRLDLRGAGGVRRTLVVGGDRPEVLVDSARGDGGESLRVTYADWREIEGRRLPFRVRMDLPQREITARVEVERYELDPRVPADAFEMP